MTLLFYIILALAGAALLGFAAAWFWQNDRLEKQAGQVKDLELELRAERAASNRLQAEKETQQLSLDNLQKLMQNLEGQCFGLEQDVRRAKHETELLRDEKHRLMAEIDAQIKETEAIRELPEINLDVEVEDGEEGELDMRTKAKKLVRAFKKGYQADGPPPTNS